MGYSTDFYGSFKVNKILDVETCHLLRGLNQTRRMGRKGLPAEFGEEGEFYIGKGDFGQDKEDNIIDYNRPPRTQPSLWCQWTPNGDGTEIEWDGGEKFYCYVEWLEYLIEKILAPRGYKLTGEVKWQGEESEDMGIIKVKNNKITVKRAKITFE